MVILVELAIIVALTLINGIFSGAEIAMLSVRKSRLRELADKGSRAAGAALRLRRQPERLLATVQIGVTVIGASTAVFGGARLEAPLQAWLIQMGLPESASSTLAFVVVIGLISYLSLVLGELVPKSLALAIPERFALTVAPGLRWVALLAKPLVWLLTASSNLLLRPFKDKTSFGEARLSPQELQQLLEDSATAGALNQAAAEIAVRSLDLAHVQVQALMVPRAQMLSIELDASATHLRGLLKASPHARYPVSSGPDRFIGYVLAREVAERLFDGTVELAALVRPLPSFPGSMLAVEVLRALQREQQQLGLVLHADGSVAGLITIEDIAEDLIGEILEEHELKRPEVWTTPDGWTHALGDAAIHAVNRELTERSTPRAR